MKGEGKESQIRNGIEF